MLIPVDMVGRYGIIYDARPQELPKEAWSAGNNVRFRNFFVEKFLGESQPWGSPSVAPYNVAQAATPAAAFWVYAGLAAVYCYDFSTHTDITNVGGAYSATADENWTMTNFQGIPVLNNSVDVPQVWTPVSAAQLLVDLPNWNALWKCKSMRAFRQFLVAMDITKSATQYPQMVKWSHPAAAGAVPASWDETDDTKDAGEYELGDSLGFVKDGLPLRDVFVIYKEDTVWGMQYVGGVKVMRFFKIFNDAGIINKRCVTEFINGQHFVVSQEDIFTHDGQNKRSVVEKKVLRWFMSQIDSDKYSRMFVTQVPGAKEVWACAPLGDGQEFCNVALVWNWEDGTVTFRDLDDIAGARPGQVSGIPATWDPDSTTWDTDVSGWDLRRAAAAARRLMMARPETTSKLLLADETAAFDGTSMTSYVERAAVPIAWRAEKPPDLTSHKLLTAVWPRIEGTNGGVVRVYAGYQNRPEDSVTWESPVNYTIGTDEFVPIITNGRLLAVKFESVTDIDWRLHGYELEVQKAGSF